MKKVININFQGRVIPIEETAYEILQNYITSLRTYFANEEGRDEIINDIESRIGELFDDRLKKDTSCIMDADVTNVMNSMGRPEDFETIEDDPKPKADSKNADNQKSAPAGNHNQQGKKRLYRDGQDKILGGVASGIAYYLNIDPAVIRIIFAILFIFGGSGFLIYIILWIILPSRSLVASTRKRLYRDTEERIIGGVCGGLAKYFDITPALPRIIFSAPFIFGIITSVGRSFFNPGSVMLGGFSGGTFILVYIILWIVLPEALTASEKLEMKGEKVDLNSIRDTIVSDLHGVKARAEKVGSEIVESANRVGDDLNRKGAAFGSELSTRSAQFGSEAGQALRTHSRGLGHALAVLIKAFIMILGSIIVLALCGGLIFLLGSGVGLLPLREFLLQGLGQNVLAWGSILLFIGIPILALIIWFIRRLMRAKTSNKYIGYSFGALWFLGLFCIIGFIASFSRDFSSQVGQNTDMPLLQPKNNKLTVSINRTNTHYWDSWTDIEGFISADHDSLFINTARLNIIKSSDSEYHLHIIKISRGRNRNQAQALAEKINFGVTQTENTIYLPEVFTVSKHDKWRNQRVMIVLEVPIGKEVHITEGVDNYNYFSVDWGKRRNRYNDWDRNWEDGYWWQTNKDMIMKTDGLKTIEDETKNKNENHENSDENDENSDENDNSHNTNKQEGTTPLPTNKPSKQNIKPVDSAKKEIKADSIVQLNAQTQPEASANNHIATEGFTKTQKIDKNTSINYFAGSPLGAILRVQ